MKAFLIAAAMLGIAAPAAASSPFEMTTGYVSRHLNTSERFNEANTGLGLEIPSNTESLRFGVGFFRNSYDRTSTYLGMSWRPVEFGPARIGILFGAASGYLNAPVVPMAGLSIDIGPDKGMRLHVLMMPPSPVAPAVVALQLKVPF